MIIEDEPIPDPEEGGRPYIIMAMRVASEKGTETGSERIN